MISVGRYNKIVYRVLKCIVLFEMQNFWERENGKIFHVLVFTLDDHNGWGWARPKPDLPCGRRVLRTFAVFCSFSRYINQQDVGLEPMFIWDTNDAGTDLAYCAIFLILSGILKVSCYTVPISYKERYRFYFCWSWTALNWEINWKRN